MPIVQSKTKNAETEITPELEQRILFSLLEDISGEKEVLAQQSKVNFSLLEDINAAKEEIDIERIRINTVMQNLNDGVVAFDSDRNVILANPMITKLTGLPKEGFSLTEFTKLFKGVDVDAKIKIAFEKRQTTHLENITLIGRFFYEMFFVPIINPQNNIIGGTIVLHDITHIKEIERMKTEFVAVASHQLRTPLTAIKLFIEMLSKGKHGKLNAKQKEFVDDVEKSTQRMIRLVNDLLNVSRLETGRLKIEPQATQVEEFIQSIIAELEPTAKERKCEILFQKPKKKLAKIGIDASLMRQVVHNLITNAIRYSPVKQCDIIVTVKQENNKTKKQPEIIVSVKDSGIGIPEEAQPRIFEKFFRADNAVKTETEGSGLGMYVAKMIVEASGGKIWFESPPKGEKNGTIFYISIPAQGMAKKEGEKGLASEGN